MELVKCWLHLLCYVFIGIVVGNSSSSHVESSNEKAVDYVKVVSSSSASHTKPDDKAVIHLSSNCTDLNTKDCCTVVTSIDNDQYSLYLNNTGLYLAKYGIPSIVVWQVKVKLMAFASNDISADLLVHEGFLYVYLINYEHQLFLFQYKDKGNTVSLIYRAIFAQHEHMLAMFGRSSKDVVLIIAHGNTVKTMSLSILNRYCHSQKLQFKTCHPPAIFLSTSIKPSNVNNRMFISANFSMHHLISLINDSFSRPLGYDIENMLVQCKRISSIGLAAAATTIQLSRRSSKPTITSVIPSKIIPAGGNIVNFVGQNFNSKKITILCSNQDYLMSCDRYNDTVITCLSPFLSSTECSHIIYDSAISVALSSIGLIVSPDPVIEALSYSLDGPSMNLVIMGDHFTAVVKSQISVFIGTSHCTLVTVDSKMITCIATLSNTNLHKVSLNVSIRMAGFHYSQTIEHSAEDGGMQESVPYVPIIVVIIIIFASFIILLLGVIGASLWKRKHNRTIESHQMSMVIKPHELGGRRLSVDYHKENIYESVQEYQKNIITSKQQSTGGIHHGDPIVNDPVNHHQGIALQHSTVPILLEEEQSYIPMHSAGLPATPDYNNNTIVEQTIPEYITMVSSNT